MTIKNNNIDRRISKSKNALKEALLVLMKKKDFKKISITDIVQLADLNRGTFYKHYQYKEDILEEIIDDVITDLIASYREPYKESESFDVSKLSPSAIKVFDHVWKYANFYTLIVQSNALLGFQNRFCNVLKTLALQELSDQMSNPNINRELHASYQAYAILGMIIELVNEGFKYSSIYMAEQLLEIIMNSKTNTIVKPNIVGN
jgi:AcrR family transcriptional regulator